MRSYVIMLQSSRMMHWTNPQLRIPSAGAPRPLIIPKLLLTPKQGLATPKLVVTPPPGRSKLFQSVRALFFL